MKSLPRRAVLVGSLVVILVLVIVFVPRGGGGNNDEPADSESDTSVTSIADAGPEIEATLVEAAGALAEIDPAVNAVLATATFTIDASVNLDGQDEAMEIEVDRGAGRFRSVHSIYLGDDLPPSVTEKIETPETVYIRVVDEDPAADPFWSVIPVDHPDQLEIGRVDTLFGRVTANLDELVRMWGTLTVEVRSLSVDREFVGYRVTARTDEVSRYLRANDLAIVGLSDEIGASTWEVWIDDGFMHRLKASGVQYFTGEPFRNTAIDITYRPGPVTIEEPAIPLGPTPP